MDRIDKPGTASDPATGHHILWQVMCILAITTLLGPTPAFGQKPVEKKIDKLAEWKKKIDNLDAYVCNLVIRERVKGGLAEPAQVYMKVRRKPKSIYLYFLRPLHLEVLFVAGRHEGKMGVHHTVGCGVGPIWLPPKHSLFMKGRRHPLTQLTIADCFDRVMKELVAHPNHEIQWRNGARINGRSCVVADISYASRQCNANVSRMRVYHDVELQLPVRFEMHGWTPASEDQSTLLEEYTYLRVNLHPRLSDEDFDEENPNYSFSARRRARTASKPEPASEKQSTPSTSPSPNNESQVPRRSRVPWCLRRLKRCCR